MHQQISRYKWLFFLCVLGLSTAGCHMPISAMRHNNTGLALYHKGQYDAAIKEYQTALRSQPQNMLLHDNLGLALYHNGQKAEARQEWMQVTQSGNSQLATLARHQLDTMH